MTHLHELLRTERLTSLGSEIGPYRRAINGLVRAGYDTVEKVAATPDAELLERGRMFGELGLMYIRELVPQEGA